MENSTCHLADVNVKLISVPEDDFLELPLHSVVLSGESVCHRRKTVTLIFKFWRILPRTLSEEN